METSTQADIAEVIHNRGFSEATYLDDGYDSAVYKGQILGKEVLVKAYHRAPEALTFEAYKAVLQWYFSVGKQVRTFLKVNQNPLNQTIEVDENTIQLKYVCADFGLLVKSKNLLMSLVRHPIEGRSLSEGIAYSGLQDHWSETPPSDIERKLIDLANSTLGEIAKQLSIASQKIDPTNVKLSYDADQKILTLTFTDIYARILTAYS